MSGKKGSSNSPATISAKAPVNSSVSSSAKAPAKSPASSSAKAPAKSAASSSAKAPAKFAAYISAKSPAKFPVGIGANDFMGFGCYSNVGHVPTPYVNADTLDSLSSALGDLYVNDCSTVFGGHSRVGLGSPSYVNTDILNCAFRGLYVNDQTDSGTRITYNSAREMAPEKPGIYKIYRGNEVVYIGMSQNIQERLKNHAYGKYDVDRFLREEPERADVTFEEYHNRDEARDVEHEALVAFETKNGRLPEYNQRH